MVASWGTESEAPELWGTQQGRATDNLSMAICFGLEACQHMPIVPAFGDCEFENSLGYLPKVQARPHNRAAHCLKPNKAGPSATNSYPLNPRSLGRTSALEPELGHRSGYLRSGGTCGTYLPPPLLKLECPNPSWYPVSALEKPSRLW